MVFEVFQSVVSEDLDELMHVNNVRYVQWVQEIAKAHWQSVTTPTQQQENVWVLLSHQIDYKSSAVLHDEIHLKTYVTRTEGVTSTRIVEMYHKGTQKLIVKSKTNWCLLDGKSKKPKRITPEIVNVFQ